uniref:Uncharacterized protein n=1 Tax=Anguilla anguilla TaxID=7936 RepID=A0A0E9VDE3_ANGAN
MSSPHAVYLFVSSSSSSSSKMSVPSCTKITQDKDN